LIFVRAGWFRLIALAEAVSWVGLLIGMYYKYLGAANRDRRQGVRHDPRLIFIAFVVAGLLVGIAFKCRRAHGCCVAGEHVPLCSDLPHMATGRPNGACGGNLGGRATDNEHPNNVTDLWA